MRRVVLLGTEFTREGREGAVSAVMKIFSFLNDVFVTHQNRQIIYLRSVFHYM